MNFRGGMGMIPGGYQFSDPRTGRKWADTHTFALQRVGEILAHRRGNPKVYVLPVDAKWLEEATVMQELTDQNCSRIGNNPNYCNDGTLATVRNVDSMKGVAPLPAPACAKCNAPMVARYCPTCSGHKVIGYTCPACNHRIDI